MLSNVHWRARALLGPAARSSARTIADAVLAPLWGSVVGSHATDRVALTLDDGPDAEVTPGILDLLEERQAPCTFFVLAHQVRDHPELTRRIVAGGHELALHGWDHRRLTDLPSAAATAYVRDARRLVEDIAQVAVRWYRPPYGAQSITSYRAVRRAGLDVVVWSADADDWTDGPVELVAGRAFERLRGGGILLLHERLEPGPLGERVETTFDRVEMLRGVLAGCGERGWAATTVGSLVADGARRTAWLRP